MHIYMYYCYKDKIKLFIHIMCKSVCVLGSTLLILMNLRIVMQLDSCRKNV